MKTLNKDLAVIQLNQAIEQLKEIDIGDIVSIYNDYASKNHYELIHDNDEENINTLFETPYEAAQAVVYGEYNPNDDYVTLDGYSNAVSFSYHPIQDDNCPIDISDLAQWLINEDKLCDYNIEVITLDDMLASIEDNINDIDSVDNIIRLLNYLDIDYLSLTEWLTNDRNDIDSYIQNYIDFIIEVISNDMNYNTLVNLCDYFNINY